MAGISLRFNFGTQPAWGLRARELFNVPYNMFDPHPDVKPDPGDAGRYLRRFRLGEHAAKAGMNPGDYVRLAEHHFGVLEVAGVHLPDREHCFDRLGSTEPRGLQLYTSVAAIYGESLHDIEGPQKRALASQLFDSLHAYFWWTRINGGRFVLSDLVKFNQYRLGTTADDPVRGLYLHDISPHLIDHEQPYDHTWWERERDRLDELAEYVGATLTDNPLYREPVTNQEE